MAREYFCAYYSLLETMEPLNDAEKGRLFTACLIYSMTGEAPQLSGNERFVFPGLRSQIDRDREKYDAFCEKQAENGKKGGRPKTQANPPEPNVTQKTQAFFEKPKKANTKTKTKTKAKEKAKENTTLGIPPYPPLEGGADGFSRFWEAYPKKKAKEDAKKAWAKLSPDAKLTDAIITDVLRQAASDQWQKDNGQYIPYPASYLRGRRWEDAPDKETVKNGVKSRAMQISQRKYTAQDLAHIGVNLLEE